MLSFYSQELAQSKGPESWFKNTCCALRCASHWDMLNAVMCYQLYSLPFYYHIIFELGYIVTFTKVLTIYHSWIYPLYHSPLSYTLPIPGMFSICFIFPFVFPFLYPSFHKPQLYNILQSSKSLFKIFLYLFLIVYSYNCFYYTHALTESQKI
jgi:hypothetical protein